MEKVVIWIECDHSFFFCFIINNSMDYIGWHADREASAIGKDTIASISLGHPRRFCFRHKKKKNLPHFEYSLTPGSLIVMQGTTQKYWKHTVPKEPRVTESRINLTFRIN